MDRIGIRTMRGRDARESVGILADGCAKHLRHVHVFTGDRAQRAHRSKVAPRRRVQQAVEQRPDGGAIDRDGDVR